MKKGGLGKWEVGSEEVFELKFECKSEFLKVSRIVFSAFIKLFIIEQNENDERVIVCDKGGKKGHRCSNENLERNN